MGKLIEEGKGMLTEVRHDIDSSGDFAVLAGDKFFGFKGGI